MNRFRFVLYFTLCLALAVVGGVLPQGPLFAQAQAEFVPDEIVIKLWSASDLESVATQYGLRLPAIDQFGSRPLYRLGIADGVAPPDKVEAIKSDSRVQYVEPNYLNYTPEGQKQSSWARVDGISDYATQWAASKLRLPEAHAVNRGTGTIVAVLDTGIDAGHPALAGRVVAGFDFVDMDSDPSEVGVVGQDLVYGHGTHIAGIVAVTAPDARIMPIRVLDRNGAGNIWVLAEALAYAVDPDGNPATDDGADVINLSLSTMRPTSLMNEVVALVTCSGDDDDDHNNDGNSSGETSDDLDGQSDQNDSDDGENESGDDDACGVRKGSVVVAAAGNNSSSIVEYPAGEGNPGLMAVAATTSADTLAIFSNRGSWVHVAAPGEAILSAIPGNQSGAWSGTSMAAPFASGVAALVMSVNPTLTPAQVIQHIQSTATDIGGDVPLRLDAAGALGVTASVGQSKGLNLPLVQAINAGMMAHS